MPYFDAVYELAGGKGILWQSHWAERVVPVTRLNYCKLVHGLLQSTLSIRSESFVFALDN
jgi:hypothetical protein